MNHFYNTRMWLHKIRLTHQVRAWMCGNGPERTAAHCMYYLNSLARYGGRHKFLIYQFKNHLIKLFYEQGLCTQVTLQRQTMECWSCNGTGEFWLGEECWKCGGTGIYRQHYLYRFVFNIHGKRYIWHQPNGLVSWPVAVAMAGLGTYQSNHSGDIWLNDRVAELYTLTVWEYLRQHGITEPAMRYNFPTLWRSLRVDWLNSTLRRRWYAGRIYSAWNAIKRLWAFAQTGIYPMTEDEIPF